MTASIIGFKTPQADLHRKSPKIFAASVVISLILITAVLHYPLPDSSQTMKKVTPPPVIIELQNIPETRFAVRTPAPAKPFIPGGMPLEVEDEFMPDEITIQDTELDMDAVPEAPPAMFVPQANTGAGEEEEQIYEFFSVEQEPQRLDNIAPEYPAMASRAGIEGNITLKVLVNTQGAVDSVAVMDGPEIFHAAAIAAAKHTPFEPARHNDRPVACWVYMSYRFQLTN